MDTRGAAGTFARGSPRRGAPVVPGPHTFYSDRAILSMMGGVKSGSRPALRKTWAAQAACVSGGRGAMSAMGHEFQQAYPSETG